MSAMGAEVSTRDAPTNQMPQALTKQHGDWLVRISKQWLHKQGCTKDCRQLSGFSRHGVMDEAPGSLHLSVAVMRWKPPLETSVVCAGRMFSFGSKEMFFQNSKSVIQASIRLRSISGMPRGCATNHARLVRLTQQLIVKARPHACTTHHCFTFSALPHNSLLAEAVYPGACKLVPAHRGFVVLPRKVQILQQDPARAKALSRGRAALTRFGDTRTHGCPRTWILIAVR
jgi:hypothetical protein